MVIILLINNSIKVENENKITKKILYLIVIIYVELGFK